MEPSLILKPWHERTLVVFVVSAFVILAGIFSLGPIFEGPDEIEHYRYIRLLEQTGRLPDPYSQPQGELFQPPLYYALATPLTVLVDDPDFDAIDGRRNPFHGYEIGIPSSDNKNVFLHARAEWFPYRESGVARSVHILRLLSIVLGAGTLLTSYAIFRRLWPSGPAKRILALGFVAFLPQFVYLSSVINNDNLLILLATLSLLLVLRMQQDGPSWSETLSLGMVLGLALLTKVSAAFLVFPVGLAALLRLRQWWRHAVVTLAVVVAVAGWWYARNWLLYGDPTGLDALFATWQSELIRPGGLALGIGLSRVPYAYRGFWARFGYGAVPVGEPIYRLFDLLAVGAIIGLALDVARNRVGEGKQRLLNNGNRWQQSLVVAIFGLAWVAVLVYHSSQAWSGNQGRYVLPGIAAWGATFSSGLSKLTPLRFRLHAALGGLGLMLSATVISLLAFFLPAYRVSTAPATFETHLSYRYEGIAELTGIDPPVMRGHPGETVSITLFWQALKPTTADLQTYLHSVDSDIVRRDSHPATGNLMSSDWQARETWAETYIVVIPENAEPQTSYPLVAGLYDPETGTTLAATDADGNPVTPIIGQLGVSGPQVQARSDFRFGEVIGLEDTKLSRSGDRLEVCADWHALQSVDRNYHVFIHVLSQDGTVLTQSDVQPKNGAYPTSVWSPGERIEDCMALDISGLTGVQFRVGLGLYDVDTGERLPVIDADGVPLADNMLLLSQ